MRAYKIAVGSLLFQFAIPIAVAIGFAGPLTGSTSTIGLLADALSNPSTWIKLGLPLLSIGVTSRIFGLQTNLGALIFAATFFVGNIPLAATITQLYNVNLMLPTIDAFLTGIINVVFLFAFIQLASSPAKGAH